MKNIVVIGGGAAGFFAAINCGGKNPDYRVSILEKSSQLLSKVKISGGGRCNVTHACFDARQLAKYYPRGERQLLGPFTRFNPTHTIEWFNDRNIKLKTEADGRIFPVTDSSQTIIDCFLNEAQKLNVQVKILCGVEDLIPPAGNNEKWQVVTNKNYTIEADAVIVTTGSGSRIWNILEKMGHTIIPPVPSLFTFNIKDERIKGLEGLAVQNVSVSIVADTPNKRAQKLSATGPLLITHWGMSGPAILRLSAWGACVLAAVNHKFEIEVNWLNSDIHTAKEFLKQYKQNHPKKNVSSNPLFNIPKRFWERLISIILSSSNASLNYADLSNKQIDLLALELTAARFHVSGKSTYKDEFVTAGGVDLDEVDFKTMQSKKFQGLYFAGEVLDIDAITGGFNFQAAWTTAWICGNAIFNEYPFVYPKSTKSKMNTS